MKVACPTCARVLTVPPDKVALPRLKARCPCGIEFAVTGPAAIPIPARLAMAEAPSAAAVPVAVPRPAAAPPPVPPPPDAAARRAPARPAPWPRCSNHPQNRSSFVCPKCVAGYCEACVQKVQGGAICAACDGLCVTTQKYADRQSTSEQRARTMTQDIGLIAGYPFRDPLGFVLLALFTWVFRYFAGYLANGVLMMYTFHALTRVSNGDLKSSMPDFTDVYDLLLPARLAFVAFAISTGPLIAVTLLVPGVFDIMVVSAPTANVHAAQPAPAEDEGEPPADASLRPDHDEEDEEEDDAGDDAAHHDAGPAGRKHDAWRHEEEKLGGLAILFFGLAIAWKVIYTPVALTVAALSRSYLSTLNPVIGFGTIGRMGAIYWHAMVLYTILIAAQWGLGLGLDKIPIAGAFVRSFTDAYAQLAIACTLGLAVFKKAAALGWD